MHEVGVLAADQVAECQQVLEVGAGMLKKPVAIASVGPTAMTKIKRRAARIMLISLSRFTPASSPARTESSATPVMQMISTTLVVSVAGMPKR